MTTTIEQAAVKSLTESEGLTFIEQLTAIAEQLCPNPKVPYLTGYNAEHKKLLLIRGTCGLWSCPVCGARNGKRWLARLLHHINNNRDKNWYFITITAHENWRGQERSVKNIRKGWSKLRKRLRRRFGDFDYCKVWEFHEDGSFHMHLLINRKVGQRWLKDKSRACGMGYMAHSSKSKNGGQVAGYAAKYLLKSFENADRYPKNLRRIEVSPGWSPLPDLNEDEQWTWSVSFDKDTQNRQKEYWSNVMQYRVTDLRPTLTQLAKLDISKGLY